MQATVKPAQANLCPAVSWWHHTASTLTCHIPLHTNSYPHSYNYSPPPTHSSPQSQQLLKRSVSVTAVLVPSPYSPCPTFRRRGGIGEVKIFPPTPLSCLRQCDLQKSQDSLKEWGYVSVCVVCVRAYRYFFTVSLLDCYSWFAAIKSQPVALLFVIMGTMGSVLCPEREAWI